MTSKPERIDPQDRRLTGARIPRFVNLDSPEVTERLRRLARRLRERYPDPQNALQRAKEYALAVSRWREVGFSEAERAEFAAMVERWLPPDADAVGSASPVPSPSAAPSPTRSR